MGREDKNMHVKLTINIGNELIQNPGTISAFMGVSLGKPFYSKENITKYFLWAEEHCKDFLLLLADDPERWNYQIFKKQEKNDALELARKSGQEYKAGFMKIIDKHNLKKISVKTWRETFENEREYADMLDNLKAAYEQDKNFRKDVEETVQKNIGSKIKEVVESKKRDASEFLANYLLEELAASVWLIRNEFPVEINLRELPTINRKLYEGEYKDLSKETSDLSGWGYVQLTPP